MARRLAAVPDSPARVVLYVRVSALMGRSGEDFHSPAMQVDAMQRAVQARGMTVVDVVEDIDRTGRTFAREGIQRVMRMARGREVDAVALYDLSRLGRNAGESLRHVAELRDLGVRIISTVEQIDDSPEGQFMLGQFLGMAQLYSDQIGRRWGEVIAANARKGVLHGRAPLGYVRTERRTVEPDPVLGPAMTEAFRRGAAGESLLAIARDLSRAAGRTVWPRTVRDCFRSPTYLGLVPHLGEALPGRHPPLTDRDTWEAVQRRLNAAARLPARTKEARWALAGLVRCEGCGRALWRRTDRGGYLTCRSRQRDGMSDCPGVGAPRVAEVEEAVLEQVRRRLVNQPDKSAAEAVRMSKVTRTRSDLRSVFDELGRVDRSVSVLTVKLAEGVLTDAAYASAVRTLEERRRLLFDQRVALEVAVGEERTFEAAQDLAVALLELWPGMETSDRNAALRALVEAVIVRRAGFPGEPVADRVEVRFYGGC